MTKTSIAAIAGGLFLVSLVGFNILVADGSEDNPVITSIRDGETEVTTKGEVEDVIEETPEAAVEALGVYTNYDQASFAAAHEREDRVVLFFSAAWCPTCVSLKRNLNAGVIPDGLSLLELDYDTETELKRKHGVTFQHTLVEVDANGDTIKKWAGSPDIDSIINEL